MASPTELEQQQRSRTVMWSAVIVGVLLLGGLITVGSIGVGRHRSPKMETTSITGVGTGKPAQLDAESALAKEDPAGVEDRTGGRARSIKQTSRAIQLSDQERQRLRSVTAAAEGPKLDAAGFELMIGTSIPDKTPIADLPPEVSEIMNGFWGDQYLMVQDNLVIVDQHTRRVARSFPIWPNDTANPRRGEAKADIYAQEIQRRP